jgi:glucose-6-phosphate isomerase
MRLFDKIAAMKAGEKINGTEKRQVQHYKLRT